MENKTFFVKDKSSSFVVNCMKIIDGHKIMTVLANVKQSESIHFFNTDMWDCRPKYKIGVKKNKIAEFQPYICICILISH